LQYGRLAAVTPTERLLTILRLVEGQGGHSTSAYVKARMSEEYPGDAGDRKFRRDLRVLRERGLLQSDLPPNRTGLRRMPAPDKPPALHLSEDEHAALIRARRLLRDGLPEVSPLDRPHGQDEAPIDTAMRVLRFVEEHGDEVEVDQLAGWLERPPAEVRRLLLSLMDDVPVLDGRLVVSLQPSYPDDDADGDADDPVLAAVYVLRSGSGGGSPLRRQGLDELGFFPYTLAEIEDRLALIADGLESGQIEQAACAHLEGARFKLERWRGILLKQPMS
jgi:hypothetical protein